MHKIKSRAFTLIELIIVIAIIAILAVTAFLILTKWMGKSRDGRRVNDISAINSALQIYISDASLIPLPDSYSGVYDTGYALARYQGNFTDNIASQLSNISKNIKDPQNGYYGYSVTFDRKQYQLRALTENIVGYQTNYITKQVYASSQTAKMQGNYAGFVVTATGNIHALWNVPSLFLFSGTAITSGYLFTGGNNNFLQDNKTIDNTYPLAIVDISNLYNSSTADDAAVYNNIINAYSGTNNVTTSSGATAVVQSAAGGIGNSVTIPNATSTLGTSSSNPGTNCLAIKQANASSLNGMYWIKPDSNTAFQVYCDMVTDGGGYTLVLRSGHGSAGGIGTFISTVRGANPDLTTNGNILPKFTFTKMFMNVSDGTNSLTGVGALTNTDILGANSCKISGQIGYCGPGELSNYYTSAALGVGNNGYTHQDVIAVSDGTNFREVFGRVNKGRSPGEPNHPNICAYNSACGYGPTAVVKIYIR